MTRLRCTIPGRPIPAVRMTQRSKWVDPKARRYIAYKQAVGYHALAAGLPRPIPWEWVGLRLLVYLRAVEVRKGVTRLPKNAGDWDNYAKAVQDALQSAGYLANDRAVIEGYVRLLPCASRAEERVEIELYPVEEAIG